MIGATAFVMESRPNTLVSAQREREASQIDNARQKRTKDCTHVLEGLLNKRTVEIDARIVDENVNTPLLGHQTGRGD